MNKLIIIRGNSGSGKSSVAKRLQREFGRNTLLIPQDVVRRDMLWAEDGYDTAALPLLADLLQYGYQNSKVTILEGILYSKYYSPLFERAVALFGNHIFAYYYDLPFEETLKRHETKEKRFEFGEEEMRRWWNEKDFIGFIREKTLDKTVSLEDAVRLIRSDVMGGEFPGGKEETE
ncbi:MAG: uridine kinase [Lachnospiraceae bacterium]|nr:uridine kinase [Lachnospiraceae bacterium]